MTDKLLSISCLIEKTEVTKLVREDTFSENQNASTSSDPDKFLPILCLAWGAMLDSGRNLNIICDFQVRLLEQYQLLIMEPDSIAKYLVCEILIRQQMKTTNMPILQCIVAMVCNQNFDHLFGAPTAY